MADDNVETFAFQVNIQKCLFNQYLVMQAEIAQLMSLIINTFYR